MCLTLKAEIVWFPPSMYFTSASSNNNYLVIFFSITNWSKNLHFIEKWALRRQEIIKGYFDFFIMIKNLRKFKKDVRKFVFEILDRRKAESSPCHFIHVQNRMAELCPHTSLVIMNRDGLFCLLVFFSCCGALLFFFNFLFYVGV